MARPIWSGSITFGLVTVPVAMYSATEDHTVAFRQLERGTSDRVRYRRVNERTGEEVDYRDIVKGYETGKDEYVTVEPDELAEIAPGRSQDIEIDTFVELGEIDPVFFDRTYWLAPADPKHAHAYHLLRRALAKTDRVGIALFVMRGKEYLTAIRAGDPVIVLETMRFADEIRDPAQEIPDLAKPERSRPKELDMAVDLIDSMAGAWRPESYRDDYQERVRKLIGNKKAGRKTKPASAPSEATNVVDLTDALRRSVKRAKGSSTRSTGTKKSDDLAGMSKKDLTGLAKDLGIKGRSAMNRDELAKAVRAAKPGRRKAS